MTSQETKFRQAAWAYGVYGVSYLGGAVTLAAMGVTPRALASRDWVWFGLGGIILILFPWLLWRGDTWFARGRVDTHGLWRVGVLPADGGRRSHGRAGRLGPVRPRQMVLGVG